MSVDLLQPHMMSIITADSKDSVNIHVTSSLYTLFDTSSLSFVTIKRNEKNHHSVIDMYQWNENLINQHFIQNCSDNHMQENKLRILMINDTSNLPSLFVNKHIQNYILTYKSDNLFTIILTNHVNNHKLSSIELLLAQYHQTLHKFELLSKRNIHSEFMQYISELKPVLDAREDTKTTIQRILQIVGKMYYSKAGIMLFDQRDQQLVLQPPSFQASIDSINRYRIQPEQPGNASRVFKTGKPYYSNKAIGDPNIIQQFVHLFGVKNLATIPINGKEKRIGVLHLINKDDRKWQENDLKTLYWVGAQIGNIIENAKLIQEVIDQRTLAEETLQKLKKQKEITEQQRKELIKQRKELKKSVSIYNQFSNLILDGKGIKGIIKTLANELQCSIILTDLFHKIIASHVDHEHHTIKEKVKIGQYLSEHSKWNKVNVTHRNKKYGYIYLSESRHLEKTKWAKVLLKQSKQSICIELMHKKSIEDLRKKRMAKLLKQIIEEEISDEAFIIRKAQSLEINLKQKHVFFVCEQKQSHRHTATEQIRSHLERYLEDRNIRYLLLEREQQLILMLSVDNLQERLMITHSYFARQLKEQVLQGDYRIGISQIYDQLSKYHEAHNEAQKAITFAKSFRKSIVEISEFSSWEMLLDLKSESMKKFIDQHLGPLIEYDKEHNSELLHTLSAYMESNYILKDTARICHFHINTIRYRIAKIEEVLNCSLRNSHTLFNLQLALKLHFLSQQT